MPQIEEIVDEDVDTQQFDNDDDFDVSNPFSRDMPMESNVARLRPTSQPKPARNEPNFDDDPDVPSLSDMLPTGGDPGMPPIGGRQLPMSSRNEIPEHMKKWPIIYPIYFDKRRSHAEGRRVGVEDAVNSPLATTISEGCKALGYTCALELMKSHPQDWANPGRVRVDTRGTSKRQLYKQLSEYLKKNPANEKTARVEMYRQLAPFDSIHPLAVPRGMKMGNTLPGVSPALSAQKRLEQDAKQLSDPAAFSKMMSGGM